MAYTHPSSLALKTRTPLCIPRQRSFPDSQTCRDAMVPDEGTEQSPLVAAEAGEVEVLLRLVCAKARALLRDEPQAGNVSWKYGNIQVLSKVAQAKK